MKTKDINQQAFFELLRTGLWGNGNPDIRIDGATDWQEVYQLAQEQSVQGLVLQGIEELRAKNLELRVPQMLLLQWIGEVQIIEQQNKEMNAFLAELIERLRKNDIYALLVKGQGVAQCYEKPLWRLSGDVDLFLSDSNYEKAKRLLLPLASSVETERLSVLHLGMTINGWVVELHGKLNGYLSSRVIKLLLLIQHDTFFDGKVRSWMNAKTQVFLLKEENEILFGFVHFLNHFYKGGFGMKQICDWCRLLWTFKDSLDYKLLESRVEKAGLMTEWKTFAAFAVDFLGMPVDAMPFYSNSERWKRKAARIMNFLLSSSNLEDNRDSGYMRYPYLIRKCISLGRRIGDLINHARIFPLDSLRFFPRIMFNGVMSAMRGE